MKSSNSWKPLDFEPEGGFTLAVDLCNGNGLVAKKLKSCVLPSKLTHEEFHSTRARAQALRAIVHQRLPLEALSEQGLHDVMDLCLLCKGCKTECPSQIDMAKMKSEFLYHYQKNGDILRSRLFSHLGQLYAWLSPFAPFFNWMNQRPALKKVVQWFGLSSTRPLPPLTTQRFSTWFTRHLQPNPSKQMPVVLLNDTFTEFNHPEIGQAAVHLLNALGYRVILAAWKCCGRPALSKGWLPYARQQATQLIDHLQPYAAQGSQIIGLEPSCLLTLRDDYLALLPKDLEKKATQVIAACSLLDEFLFQRLDDVRLLPFQETKRTVHVHGHCYQKALVGMKQTLELLRAIPGFNVKEIVSGCCGMAGSFGYEKEHEALSLQIGELHLFPAVRSTAAEEWIIANGMSCRHQIRDGTQKKPLHLAEALFTHLSNSDAIN